MMSRTLKLNLEVLSVATNGFKNVSDNLQQSRILCGAPTARKHHTAI